MESQGIIIGALVFGIVLIVLIAGIRSLKRNFDRPQSEKEIAQMQIDGMASKQPDGPGAGLKHYRGCRRAFWTVISFILAGLLIYFILSGLEL